MNSATLPSLVAQSLAALLLAYCAVGCVDNPVIKSPSPAALKSANPGSMIDDAEDQNNQVMVQEGRSGYWYTYVDDAGSTIEPTAGAQGGTFTMTKGGANGSEYAAHMQGQIKEGGTVYGGMGFSLTDPKSDYDASKFGGVAFYAKHGAGTNKIRVKIPDVSTDPEGGVCKQCFNDFGASLELTEAWTQYVLPFAEVKQDPGWGAPRVPTITPAKIYGLQWQVNVRGAPFDVWVDDVAFVDGEK